MPTLKKKIAWPSRPTPSAIFKRQRQLIQSVARLTGDVGGEFDGRFEWQLSQQQLQHTRVGPAERHHRRWVHNQRKFTTQAVGVLAQPGRQLIIAR